MVFIFPIIPFIMYLLFKQLSPKCKPFRDPWFYVANVALIGALWGISAYAWDYVMKDHSGTSH